MEVGTVKELQDLENMVINWSRSYVTQVDVHGGNEHLLDEFKEEVGFYIIPYIRRLYQAGYLTKEEATEFANTISAYLINFMCLVQEYDEEDLTTEE